MQDKRGIAILAAVSAALLAVSIGYFALTPGAWSSLGFGARDSSLLQTTASDSESGSADATADKGKGSAAQATASESKGDKAAGNDENARTAAGESVAPASSTSSDAPADTPGSPSAPASDSAADASASQDPAPTPAQAITVTVSVSSSAAGNPVSASGTYALDKGATAYDALLKLGLSVNAPSSSMGVYVAAIGGLAEKEHGPSSGWMFSVNGTAPDRSASSYELRDGDSVEWYYVVG